MTVGKVVELIGSSKESFEGAVKNAVNEAAKTIREIREVWVQDLKASVENGKITEYRAGVKVTFLVEEER